MVVDASGNLVAVNNKAPNGKEINVDKLYKQSYRDADWFKSAIAGRFTEDKDRGYAGTLVEGAHVDPYTSEIYGEKRFGTSFTTTIKDGSGKVIGVISNRAGSRWFENEFVNLYGSMKKIGLDRAELLLVDSKGAILVDFDPATKNGSTEITHDFNVIGKQSTTKEDAIQQVLAGADGKMISTLNAKKLTLATGFTPIVDKKWIPSLGWNVLVRSDANDAFASINAMEEVFYGVFGVLIVLALVVSIFFSSSLTKTFLSLSARLNTAASVVLAASKELSKTSESLSSSVTEQAAAIQETAASIDEVSAMVKKNSENATLSKQSSTENQEVARGGQASVQKMIQSIKHISQRNERKLKKTTE